MGHDIKPIINVAQQTLQSLCWISLNRTMTFRNVIMNDAPVATTVLKKPIKKTPLPKEKPLGLLKLSRDDLHNIYKMFCDVIRSKDFDNKYDVYTKFIFEDGAVNNITCYADGVLFEDILQLDSEITGIKMKIVMFQKPVNPIRVIPSNIDSFQVDDELIPSVFTLILSESEAKLVIDTTKFYLVNDDVIIRQIEDLKEKITNYLKENERKRVSNKFVNSWYGYLIMFIIATIISSYIYIQQVLLQHKPLDLTEMYLLAIVSDAIGFGIGYGTQKMLINKNRVVFESKKPGIESSMRGFFVRNQSNIEAGIITIAVAVIIGILGWLGGIIQIHI